MTRMASSGEICELDDVAGPVSVNQVQDDGEWQDREQCQPLTESALASTTDSEQNQSGTALCDDLVTLASELQLQLQLQLSVHITLQSLTTLTTLKSSAQGLILRFLLCIVQKGTAYNIRPETFFDIPPLVG